MYVYTYLCIWKCNYSVCKNAIAHHVQHLTNDVKLKIRIDKLQVSILFHNHRLPMKLRYISIYRFYFHTFNSYRIVLHIDTSFSLYWYIGKLKRISIHSETSCNRLLKPNWIQQQTHVEEYCDFSLIWLKLNAMAAIFEDVSSVFLWLNKINVYHRNVEKCSTQPNHRDLQVEKRQTKTEPGTQAHTRLNWRLVSTVKSFCDKDTT